MPGYIPPGVWNQLIPKFNCTSLSCSGANVETVNLFKRLQQYISAFHQKISRPGLSIDGVLGPNTLAAYQAIRSAYPIIRDSTPEARDAKALATSALAIVNYFNGSYSVLVDQPPGNTTPPVVPVPGTNPGTPATPPVGPKLTPAQHTSATSKATTMPIIVGAIGLAALIGIYVVTRKRD